MTKVIDLFTKENKTRQDERKERTLELINKAINHFKNLRTVLELNNDGDVDLSSLIILTKTYNNSLQVFTQIDVEDSLPMLGATEYFMHSFKQSVMNSFNVSSHSVSSEESIEEDE